MPATIRLSFSSMVTAEQVDNSLFVLEEIIITAQKRVESLRDVSISASGMSGSQIQNPGISNLEEISAYIPNFTVQSGAIGDKINVRGIQSGNQAGFEQSVATYSDGVYRGSGTQSRVALFDTERVEVLRGPQGTLFGKNTIAGALNISTNKPTDEFQAMAGAQYTPEFQATETEGFINSQVAPQLSARAAFIMRETEDGWVDNALYNEKGPDTNEKAFRLSADWEAGDNTSVFIKYEHGSWDNGSQPAELITVGNLTSIGLQGNTNYRSNIGNGVTFLESIFGPGTAGNTRPVDFGSNHQFKGDTDEIAVTLEHGLENGMITAIAATSSYEFNRSIDADFNPLPVLRFDDSEDFDQTSFELRLTSDPGDSFEYIAGLFYLQSDLYADGLTHYNVDAISTLTTAACGIGGGVNPSAGGADLDSDGQNTLNDDIAATLNANAGNVSAAVARDCAPSQAADAFPNFNRYHFLNQDIESWALFAQSTWHITNKLRTTLGLRYTEEEKNAKQAAKYSENIGQRNNIDEYTTTLLLLGEGTAHERHLSRKENSFTWSANIQYDLNPDAMVYASASTGFKGGGFNSFTILAGPADDEEDVLAGEIGAKLGLLDGRGELNIAYFYTQYCDIQTSLYTGSTTFIVQNAAKAITQGIEIDGRFQATEKLTLQGSLGWLDFAYDEFPTAACTIDQLQSLRQEEWQGSNSFAPLLTLSDYSATHRNDLAGKTSENTPEFSVSLSGTYTQPIGDNHELNLTLYVNYQDKQYKQADLNESLLQEATTEVNAAITFEAQDGQWDVSLIAKNITDETSITWGNDTPLFDQSREVLLALPQELKASKADCTSKLITASTHPHAGVRLFTRCIYAECFSRI